jgi:hypothetical protein
MKLFQYRLSEWAPSSNMPTDTPNWWRHGNTPNGTLHIGLLINGFDIDISQRYWRFDYIGPHYILGLWLTISHDPYKMYSLHELEQGKQDIDNFIIRADRLKAFL